MRQIPLVSDDEGEVEQPMGNVSEGEEEEEEVVALGGRRSEGGEIIRRAKQTVRGWLRQTLSSSSLLDLASLTSQEAEHQVFLGDDDLQYCPACIDAYDWGREGERRRKSLFLLPRMSKAVVLRVRTYSELVSAILAVGGTLPKLSSNTKLSTSERRRRQLVNACKLLPISCLDAFLSPLQPRDRSFLSSSQASVSTKEFQHSGSVCLATSSRHWMECLMILTQTELVVFKSKDDRKADLRIPLSTVLSVRELSLVEQPFAVCSFFELETSTRVYTFMVLTSDDVRGWLRVLGLAANRWMSASDLNLDEAYIAAPGGSKMKKRRVYNYRRIHFKSQLTDAVTCIERALQLAFQLSDEEKVTSNKWIEFLNLVSSLQTSNLTSLDERTRAACLLNLYHVMVLHGIFILLLRLNNLICYKR